MANGHTLGLIVLDTNVMRELGLRFSKPWFDELMAVASQARIPVAVTDLSVREWARHLAEKARERRQQLEDGIAYLKRLSLLPADLVLPERPGNEREAVTNEVRALLEQFEIRIVPDAPADLAVYLNQALDRDPPFVSGDGGLRDAVILDSAADYASASGIPHVLVVSSDKEVRRSHARFERKDVGVLPVIPANAASHLKESMEAAQAQAIVDGLAALTALAEDHRDDIFEHIRTQPVTLFNFSIQSALSDAKFSGTVERVTALRPVRIVGATPTPGRAEDDYPAERFPISVQVEIELDLVVVTSSLGGLFAETTLNAAELSEEEGAALTQDPDTFRTHRVNQTVRTTTGLRASITRPEFKVGRFVDFQIEEDATRGFAG